jgi:hypothetical protein
MASLARRPERAGRSGSATSASRRSARAPARSPPRARSLAAVRERQAGLDELGHPRVVRTLDALPGRGRVLARRRRGVPGAGQVPRQLGGVGVRAGQCRGQPGVQLGAVGGGELGGHRLPDEVVRRRPAPLAQPHQAGRGQRGQRGEHVVGRQHCRGGERRDRGLPGEQGQQPEDRTVGSRVPLDLGQQPPAPPGAGDRGRLARRGRAGGGPPASRRRGERTGPGQLPDDLGDRERQAIGATQYGPGDLEVEDLAEVGDGQRRQLHRPDRPPGRQPGQG